MTADPFTDPFADRMDEAAAAHAKAYGLPDPPEPVQDVASVGNERATGRAKTKVTAETTNPLVNAIATRTVHNWHDVGVVVAFLPAGLVGEGGEVDTSALDAALVRLAREHPYLIKDVEMPAVPLQPTSGLKASNPRRRYGPPRLDADSLRRKYPNL